MDYEYDDDDAVRVDNINRPKEDIEPTAAVSSTLQAPINNERGTVITTAANPNDDNFTFIQIRDIVPCNLRAVGTNFLRSSVNLALDTYHLRTFIRCYGYLMYNRDEKIKSLVERRKLLTAATATTTNVTSDAETMLQWLLEIRDLETFRQTLHNHLSQARTLMSDDMLETLDLDDDIDEVVRQYTDKLEKQYDTDARREKSATLSENDCGKNKISGRELLRIARDSLDQILTFLRAEDHVRRAINCNGYCRELFDVDASKAREQVNDVWLNLAGSSSTTVIDANEILSAILKDSVLSTALETHSSLLFLVRVSLLFTFLVTQTLGRDLTRCSTTITKEQLLLPSDVNVIRVYVDDDYTRNDDDDGGDSTERDAVRQYFEVYDSMTMEKFIGTVFVQIIRSAFLNFVEWPCRLLENNERTINLSAIHGALTRSLRTRHNSEESVGGGEQQSATRWLRVFGPRRNFSENTDCMLTRRTF